MIKIIGHWADGLRLADATPPVALSQPVSNLQAIKRDLEALEVGSCIEVAKRLLNRTMETAINGFLLVMFGCVLRVHL
jgi:hypothetical protein